MAIEQCSENSGMGMSPRISFSHDFCQSDMVPVEQHPFGSNSSGNIDFDFCIRESFDQESSSADELFSDGKILPIEIKKKSTPPKQLDQSLPPQSSPNSNRNLQNTISNENLNKNCSKEIKITSAESDEKQNSKSFWRFKRSTSLNCSSGYGRSLCPLPLLSRSNSTGSASNVKRDHRQHSQKNSSMGYQKPPLSKSCYGPHGNGVRVASVLNVPSVNLFGLGSIFSNGKDKSKKK